MIVTAVVVFLCMVSSDFAWTKYIAAVADVDRARATAWSVAIGAVGFVTSLSVIRHPVLIAPALAGCALGTWLAVGGQQ